MNTTDKAQVGDSTTTSTTTSQWQTYKAEQGWECPRCGRINAPWVRQCDCSRSNWSITCDDLTYKPKYNDEWWKNYVTCQRASSSTQVDSDTFKIHPESTIYTTNVNQVVGGNDYKDSATGNWVNVSKTYTNSVKR